MSFGTDSTVMGVLIVEKATNSLLIWASEQHYVEDCYVCCRPIHLSVWLDGGAPYVVARHENDC